MDDLRYGTTFSLTAMPSSFKGKTSPEVCIPPILPMIACYSSHSFLVITISNLKKAKLSRGCFLRPCSCRRLALTAMQTHFQGQISPKVCIVTVIWMIVCYSSPSLFMIRISDFKNNEISCGRWLRPLICIWFSLKAMLTNFQGQTSP